MGAACYLVLNMGITASAIGLVVLLLRLALGRRLPALARYGLWALVLLRLLLPFALPSELSALNPVARFVTPIASWPVGGQLTMTNAVGQTESMPATITNFIGTAEPDTPRAIRFKTVAAQSAFDALGAMWLAGVAATALSACVLYALTARKLRRARPAEDGGLLAQCAARVGLKRKVRLLESPDVSSPAAFGMLSPIVVIPPGLAQTPEALEPVLLHELAHIRRGDTYRPLLFLLVCLHWYNPFLWLVWLLSRSDMELACDAAVLKRLDRDGRKHYAMALASLAARPEPVLSAAFGASAVKRRVLAVVNYKRVTMLAAILSTALFVLLAVVLLTNPAVG